MNLPSLADVTPASLRPKAGATITHAPGQLARVAAVLDALSHPPIGSADYGSATFAEAPGLVFDTETTGVDIENDRIVELGAICFVLGDERHERKMRINPERPIPPGATQVHKICDEHVRDKPTFAAVAERFVPYLDGRAPDEAGGVTPWLAGYNATGFDVPLLNNELARVGLSARLCPTRVVDPMVFVRWHLRSLEKRNLESACAHFGIELCNAHSALADARATGRLLMRMVEARYIPARIEEALAEQARLRAIIDEEWRQWSYWLYRDRSDGQLRLGAGRYRGTYLSEVSRDYIRSLIAKIADLPEGVKETFRAQGA